MKQANSPEILYKGVLRGRDVSFKDAVALESCGISALLFYADRIRRRFKKNSIKLCSIINAKSGSCGEDCAFCPQSARHDTGIKIYPLVSRKIIKKAFLNAKMNRASCFGIVTSGNALAEKEVKEIISAIKYIGRQGIAKSVSLGRVSLKNMVLLKKAGVGKFHHNLEAPKSHFDQICTTHTYAERERTIKNSKKAGFKVCSGGIFGLGEDFRQRVELAFALKRLDVDSVPMNFLNPVKGTRLANAKRLTVEEMLRTIAVFRFILPGKDIFVCGGREVNLGKYQNRIFYAGANGMMVGGYLTTPGRPVKKDLAMIKKMGFRVYCGK
ncbi:MAG: biotin synthase BioB [Endomicrobiales bacterium]|nr:biotin synthase BioB [Endomicrobiales bacterium]